MESEKFDLEKSMQEVDEITERMKVREVQGLTDVYKYFDRINDKLSSFNNMLVAGYFAIVALNSNVSKFILIIPIANMAVLIYLDYIMMEQGRFMSQITSQPISKIEKYGRKQNRATKLSLLTIITTSLVTIIFLRILYTSVLKH